MHVIERCSADNIYLNVSIPNSSLNQGNTVTPLNKVAQYDQSLTIPVLQNPTDYYMSVLRFTVPLDQIPLFSFPLDIYQNNPNVSFLEIGIQLAGVQYPERIIYVSPNDLSAPTPGGSSPFFNFNDVTNPYYFIYCIQCFIDMVNVALGLAFVAAGSPGGGAAPFYIYTPTTQLISLIATTAFLGSGALIFMNAPLKTYFSSFNFTTTNSINSGPFLYFHNLTTTPYGQTSPFKFDEEYNSLDLWFDLRKVVLVSNSIPVIQEASPTHSNAAMGLNGTANYLPIISDYSVVFNNINDAASILTYYPSGQYRLADMKSNSPLTRIDLRFYWLSKNGYLYALYIGPNQTAEVKIGFFKKELYLNHKHD